MADFKHLDALLDQFVENGPAGCGCAVAKDGKVIYEAYRGYADLESKRKMDENSIYRLYSSTKVITCTAAMMLYERGKFLLNDPLSNYFPEFKDAKIVHTRPDGTRYLAPPTEVIRVKHAFSMGVGMPYAFGNSPTAEGERKVKAELTEKYGKYDIVTEVREMAKNVPLASEPGEHFLYGYGHEIVAGLIQLCSGMPTHEFVQKELLDPLGMTSTGYRYFGDTRERMVTAYNRAPDGKLTPEPHPLMDEYFEPDQIYDMGGAGIFSTVRDYTRFAQMLADGGIWEGQQIIGRKTIDLMRQNQLTPSAMKDFRAEGTYNWGYGYGLGVRTAMDPAVGGYNGSLGEFGWTGAMGTYTCIDPSERFALVYMHQMSPNMEEYHHLRVRAAAFGALK